MTDVLTTATTMTQAFQTFIVRWFGRPLQRVCVIQQRKPLYQRIVRHTRTAPPTSQQPAIPVTHRSLQCIGVETSCAFV